MVEEDIAARLRSRNPDAKTFSPEMREALLDNVMLREWRRQEARQRFERCKSRGKWWVAAALMLVALWDRIEDGVLWLLAHLAGR